MRFLFFIFFTIFFNENTNLKLYKSKEGKTIAKFYIFCAKLSGEREKINKKKKERTRSIKKYHFCQGGLASA